MIHYADLTSDVKRMAQGSTEWRPIVAKLVDKWIADYEWNAGPSDIVETDLSGFHYLFDIAGERLIAAWGVSQGRHDGERDKSRMRDHPLGAGPRYHRGHAISHRQGGGVDINLVPQIGSVNVGAFRQLEKQAIEKRGSLYFTYWRYSRTGQRPTGVDQGLLVPGEVPRIRPHAN